MRALQDGVVEPFHVVQPTNRYATSALAAVALNMPAVFPPLSLGADEAPDGSDLVSKWNKEAAPDPRWLYQTRLTMRRLKALVEHDDATRVTQEDVIRFKEQLDGRGLAAPTINRYLSEIKGPFEWAFKNKKIGVDPAEGVVFARKTRGKSRRRGYTDEQARAILLAARDEDKPYRRWIPWVCAFAGARLDEVAGRNVPDIEKVGSYYVLNIPEPEDDDDTVHVKNDNSVRRVPIHPVLVREGFIDYVDKLPKDGPLFPDLKPDRFGRRAGTATKELGRWLRRVQKDLGILLVDKVHYVPNHSWRHRFKSEARSVRMEQEVHDALTGHRDGRVSRDYGEYYVETVLGPAIESMLSPFDIVEKAA
jgi:integrase